MHVAIPVQFEFLTGTTKITFSGSSLKTAYLIHLLNKCSMEFGNGRNGFFLNSKVLKQIYGKYYKRYINYLIQHDFIHKVRHHSTTEHTSNLYALNAKSLSLKHYIINDYILERKLKKVQSEYISTVSVLRTTIPVDIRQKLVKDVYEVELDYDSALSFLNSMGSISQRKYHMNLSMLNNIKDRNLFFTFDPYGRFHSNFTNLKKEIRNNYLKIDGQELDYLDIKSSQPFFLVQILKENYTFKNTEINKFIDIVENHDIYNHIKDSSPEFNNDRDKAKRSVIMTLFDDKHKTTKHKELFKALFPLVYNFIEGYETLYKEPLWMTLQRHESLFIYNMVYRKIVKEIPTIKLLTVHDSIYFPIQHKNQIMEIWSSALKSLHN